MSHDTPPELSTLPPLPPPTTLIDLPEDVLKRITNQLDSSSTCLALALTHTSLRHSAERAIWTTVDLAPPLWYGCRPTKASRDGWGELSDYSMEHVRFHRDRLIRRRLKGIILALDSQPDKGRIVKKVIIELSTRCSEGYMDLFELLQSSIPALQIKLYNPTWVEVEMIPPHMTDDPTPETYFFQDIALRSFSFVKLVSLRLTVQFHPVANATRLLSLCPQLSELHLVCPNDVSERQQSSFEVAPTIQLEDLESLDITARGLSPLAWLAMLMPVAPNLKHAAVRRDRTTPDITNREFNRAQERCAPIIKAFTGLHSLEWCLHPVSIHAFCGSGMEDSLVNVATYSASHTPAMDRLEFLDIPPSSTLQVLHLIPRIKCRFWPKRIQPGEELRASDKVSLNICSERAIFNSLVNAPNLLEIRMKTANIPAFTHHGDRRQRKKSFRGILIRSHTNPNDGKILVRTETSARNKRVDREPGCTCAQPPGWLADPPSHKKKSTSKEAPVCPICDAYSSAEERLSHLRFSDIHSEPVVILVGPLGPKQAPASVEVRQTDGDLVSTVKRFDRTDDIKVTHEAWYDGIKVPPKIMSMVNAVSGEFGCDFIPDRAAKMGEKPWSVLEQWAERECAYRAVEREFLDKKREERDMAFQLKEREQLERVVGVPQLRAKQRAEEKVEVPWRVVPLAPERG